MRVLRMEGELAARSNLAEGAWIDTLVGGDQEFDPIDAVGAEARVTSGWTGGRFDRCLSAHRSKDRSSHEGSSDHWSQSSTRSLQRFSAAMAP